MDHDNLEDRRIQQIAKRIKKAEGIKYTEALRRAKEEVADDEAAAL